MKLAIFIRWLLQLDIHAAESSSSMAASPYTVGAESSTGDEQKVLLHGSDMIADPAPAPALVPSIHLTLTPVYPGPSAATHPAHSGSTWEPGQDHPGTATTIAGGGDDGADDNDNNSYDASGIPIPTGINVTMRLRAGAGWTRRRRRFRPGSPLLTMLLAMGPTPTARYDGDALSATDGRGRSLLLSYRDTDLDGYGRRTWYLGSPGGGGGGGDSADVYVEAEEDEEGENLGDEVVVHFFAPARHTNKKTILGPRIDLRRDAGGGLVGQGLGFIPVPPRSASAVGDVDDDRGDDDDDNDDWEVTVDWDMSPAPAGVRGAWSFGDGLSGSQARGDPEDVLSRTIFAFGLLKRYPDWDHEEEDDGVSGAAPFAMYWFGDPPFDMAKLPRTTSGVFRAIDSFFASTTSSSSLISSSLPESDSPPGGLASFRVMMRRVESGYGGTGATDSFLLEYSNRSADELSTTSVVSLLGHETTHEYALLSAADPEPGQQEVEAAWYVEGIASYYGAIAAFRGGNDEEQQRPQPSPALSRAELIGLLNDYAQAYYTSPAVGMPYAEVLTRFWEDLHVTRVCYWRGFIYIAAVQGLIARHTGGRVSFDDVALELYRRRRADLRKKKVSGNSKRGNSEDGAAADGYSLEDYHALVAELLDNDGNGTAAERASYDALLRGDLIVPDPDALAPLGLRMVRRDAERFELGFDYSAFKLDRIIRHLVAGSRAEAAGLREGDRVAQSFLAWGIADRLAALMQVTVVRRVGGEEVEKVFRWWPRSHDKVECWVWVDVGDVEEMNDENR